MTDYIINDVTNVHWPGLPAYRSADSKRGYPTRRHAEVRIRNLTRWAAAHYGSRGGPDLRIVERDRLAERCERKAFWYQGAKEYMIEHGCVLLHCGNAAAPGVQAATLRKRYPQLFGA